MAGSSQHALQIMENQTRFDLNAAIEDWRRELAAQSNLASEDRRELETHLRDATAGFQQCGLNDEESFWLARRRVGQPPQLGEEFVKADPAKVWRERAFWVVVAIFVIQLWLQTVKFIWFSSSNYLFGHLFRFLQSANVLIELFIISFSKSLPLLSFVLVMGLVILLARQHLNLCIYKFQLLFKSRFQFLLTFVAFFSVYFLLLLNIALRGDAFYEGSYFVSTSAPIKIVTILGIDYALFPIVLAGLIVWLMPTRNRKNPKHI
jgi:hypothetical protein